MRMLLVCVLLLVGSCGQEARLVGPAMVGQVVPAPEVTDEQVRDREGDAMTAFTDLHPSTRRAVIRRLDRAADLIKQGWVRGISALDAHGRCVYPTEPTAVCWCLTGAISAAMCDLVPTAIHVVDNTLYDVSKALYGYGPMTVNDTIARDRRTPLRILRVTKKRLETP